jgi:hypothetical protein
VNWGHCHCDKCQQTRRPSYTESLVHLQRKQRERRAKSISTQHQGSGGGGSVQGAVRVHHEQIGTGVDEQRTEHAEPLEYYRHDPVHTVVRSPGDNEQACRKKKAAK